MDKDVQHGSFVWDAEKNRANEAKHGVDFITASEAFFDSCRLIARDERHSEQEERWYCVGQVDGRVITVRFTKRGDLIRIIGAGYWRKGRWFYEAENKIRG